jgi:hypothetical protein
MIVLPQSLFGLIERPGVLIFRIEKYFDHSNHVPKMRIPMRELATMRVYFFLKEHLFEEAKELLIQDIFHLFLHLNKYNINIFNKLKN